MNLRFTSQTTLTTTPTSLQPSKMSTKLTLLSHKYDLQMDFEEASGRAYELGWWDGIGSQLGEFEGVDLEKNPETQSDSRIGPKAQKNSSTRHR